MNLLVQTCGFLHRVTFSRQNYDQPIEERARAAQSLVQDLLPSLEASTSLQHLVLSDIGLSGGNRTSDVLSELLQYVRPVAAPCRWPVVLSPAR